MDEKSLQDVGDAALTLGATARTRRQPPKKSTLREYARAWRRWCSWARPPAVDGRRERWRDPDNPTPDDLVDYAVDACEQGRAPGTTIKEISAIRAYLRAKGATVPDHSAALAVLRKFQDMRSPARSESQPVFLDGVLALLAALPWGRLAAVRDAAVLHLMFAGLHPEELHALDLGDITAGVDTGDRFGRGLAVQVDGRDGKPGRVVQLLHWRSAAGGHDARVCPVEAVQEQHRVASGWPDAHPGTPMFRPVDRAENVGGVDEGWWGGVMGEDGRLVVSRFGAILGRAALRGGVMASEGGVITPRGLRLGGARALLEQGAVGLGCAQPGNLSPTNPHLVRLLEQHTPPDAAEIGLVYDSDGRA